MQLMQRCRGTQTPPIAVAHGVSTKNCRFMCSNVVFGMSSVMVARRPHFQHGLSEMAIYFTVLR